jgi:tryptophan synthase alpha chain
MVDAGADIIELGMPFSDPMADGPVIQAASERVLANGTRLPDIFNLVQDFRKSNDSTPIVLMGYANPILIMGYKEFAEKSASVGVDGLITVDLPPEEAKELSDEFAKHQLDPIFLLSPTTPDSRVKAVCEQGSGFIYYVSLKGVTGSAAINTTEVADRVAHIKQISTMPVAVGFGITNAKAASEVAKVADAVVVGSVIVKCIAQKDQSTEAMISAVSNILSTMRAAIDS